MALPTPHDGTLPPTFTEWALSGGWLSPGVQALPLAPGLLGDVLSLSIDADVDGRKLTRLVARDPVLAARVLRLANVASSAPLREVTSIEQAVVRLGTSAVRRAVLSVCFASWVQPSAARGFKARAHVEHSVGTACLARVVALRVGGRSDEAFAQGLLHDIGKLFVRTLIAEWVRRGGARLEDDGIEVIVAGEHAELGSMALEAWGLPVVLREPIRWHHDPLAAPEHTREAAVLYVANRLAHRYGFGCDVEEDAALASDPVVLALGGTQHWIDDMDRQAPLIEEAAAQMSV
jgi:HD-like signal output (HDOD) protein